MSPKGTSLTTSPLATPGSLDGKTEAQLNLNTMTAPEARELQSEEQKTLGYRPPHDSIAAQAQSAVDKRAEEPVSVILLTCSVVVLFEVLT